MDQPEKNLIFSWELWQNSHNSLKIAKQVRKCIHHYALLWGKYIPTSDLNNFVRNEAEENLVSDKLFWSLGRISLSHNNACEWYRVHTGKFV